MRALITDGTQTALRDVARLEPGGEVIVRVTLSGICNTDLELARGYMGFRGTLGHEFVGVVDDPGDGAFGRGKRVVGEINAGCGVCPRCASGDPRHCPTRTVLGIVGRDGAHADLLRLPAANLVAVPDAVTDLEAVFVEPLAAACGVLERCPIVEGAAVAVIGDGKLGLLCAFVLAAKGYAPVLIGKHSAKLAIASAHGIATTTEAEERAFDVVVEASGSPSGLERALGIALPQGTIVLKSTFHGLAPIDTARVVVDELRIVGSRCGRFAPALDLLARHAVDVAPLVSESLSLDHAERALEIAATPGVLKVVLTR